jgi:hypothetical protein
MSNQCNVCLFPKSEYNVKDQELTSGSFYFTFNGDLLKMVNAVQYSKLDGI